MAGAGASGELLGGAWANDLTRSVKLFDDPALEPLRAYPRALVLVCVVFSLAGLSWLVAKIAKWSIYLVAMVVFLLGVGVMSVWLWE